MYISAYTRSPVKILYIYRKLGPPSFARGTPKRNAQDGTYIASSCPAGTRPPPSSELFTQNGMYSYTERLAHSSIHNVIPTGTRDTWLKLPYLPNFIHLHSISFSYHLHLFATSTLLPFSFRSCISALFIAVALNICTEGIERLCTIRPSTFLTALPRYLTFLAGNASVLHHTLYTLVPFTRVIFSY